MQKKLFILSLVGFLFIVGILLYRAHSRGKNNNMNIVQAPAVDSQNNLDLHDTLGLQIPANFRIEIFAKNLPGARVLIPDLKGNLLLSQTSEGIVSKIKISNGVATETQTLFKNLNKPHGLAIDPQNPNILYVAEEAKISWIDLSKPDALHPIVNLPKGGRHFTRTLGFGPDNRLYVSIGSTCDVCEEKDPRLAAIYSMQKDGTDFKQYASGLRNTVFFTWNPIDGKMWATEMGRDGLGDNTPPDEINIIEKGKNYGWPICYGKNIHDQKFDLKTYIRNPCTEPFETESHIDLPAHSAPLGLSFVPEEGWPDEYRQNLFIAYHGSWNRSSPTGYKIARIFIDAKGNFLRTEDFISGWLEGKNSSGRPVDILTLPGGVMYITDDKAGLIYRVWYVSNT